MKIAEKIVGVSIGAHPALAEENRQLRAKIVELEQLVARDTLTPLYNRRHFMTELERWCWRAQRYRGNYALLFIDVDGMKGINDAFGHGAGDRILVTIAGALLDNVRRSDLVARIGGDEFAVLLDNILPEMVPKKIASMCRAVSKEIVRHDGQVLAPKISIGYSCIEAGVTASDLILRADRSMYAVKRGKPVQD